MGPTSTSSRHFHFHFHFQFISTFIGLPLPHPPLLLSGNICTPTPSTFSRYLIFQERKTNQIKATLTPIIHLVPRPCLRRCSGYRLLLFVTVSRLLCNIGIEFTTVHIQPCDHSTDRHGRLIHVHFRLIKTAALPRRVLLDPRAGGLGILILDRHFLLGESHDYPGEPPFSLRPPSRTKRTCRPPRSCPEGSFHFIGSSSSLYPRVWKVGSWIKIQTPSFMHNFGLRNFPRVHLPKPNRRF